MRCKTIARAADEPSVPLCLSCHRQDQERSRAAQELERVRREASEREQRHADRAVRREEWIAGNRAPSEFSDFDDKSQYPSDDEYYKWDMGQDGDMNYSAQS